MNRLVLDASFCVSACGVEGGFDVVGDAQLVAPALTWSEARSVIRETLWRGEIVEQDARATYGRLASCPVQRIEHPDLHEETWRIAEQFGWARTYDAEYVALAKILGCRLVTLDGRLRRGADRLGFDVSPEELLGSEQPSEASDTDG